MHTLSCKAIRTTTNSIITIEIPSHVGLDPFDCTQWIGEEFNWQFIPMEFKIVPEGNHEKNAN